MYTKIRFALLCFVLLLLAGTTWAQSGFFIPPKAKIFFNGDTATIFSNVINRGQLGVGKKAVVNFKGNQWENDPLSLITDDSNNGDGVSGQGGIARFLSPDSNSQQTLIGGYNAASRTGPAFASLQVANSLGIQLSGGNAKVLSHLHFASGHVYTGSNILVVGNGNPGTISGYNENRFIVTSASATGGFLIREKISDADGQVTFPVGAINTKYTPAAIRSKSAVADDFFAGVFDSTMSNIFGGSNLYDKGVNKTWQIGKLLRPGQDEVEITLQHLVEEEGRLQFSPFRENAYVSQFVNGAWDMGFPQYTPGAGSLTTDNLLMNSGINARGFTGTIGTINYFSKFARPVASVNKSNLWFNAYRLDPNLVRVYWKTNPEINIHHFVVQRRLSNEAAFKNIDTVLSMAAGGYSYRELLYSIIDPNPYTGISFYRLMPVSYNGDSSYSQIVAVAGSPGKYRLTMWPNPTPNHFYIGLNGEVYVKTIVVWNAIGQLLRQEPVNGRTIIEMHGLIPGTYMVGFISTTGDVIETKKLVVVGY
jgi:hypothetical protein